MKKHVTTFALAAIALCSIAGAAVEPVSEKAPQASAAQHRAHHVQLASPFVVEPGARVAAVELAMNGDAYHAVRGHERLTLTNFALPGTTLRSGPRLVDLQLERMHVLGDAAAVVVRDQGNPAVQRELASPEVALFRGTIAGRPGSRVFLSVSAHGDVHGYVMERDGETAVLSSGPHNGEHPPLIYNPRLLDPGAINLKPWTCEVDAGSVVPPGVAMGREGAAVGAGFVEPPCRRVRVAIETDFEFTDSLFGGDMEAAAAYVLTLMGAASEIFSDNVNVEFEVVYISLWDGPGGPTPLDVVHYWLDNMSHVERDLLHYFGAQSSGGWATLWAVCDPNGYAVSLGLNGFFPYPLEDYHAQNWDPFVVTHEFGHNFGAPHTHNYCPPLDRCSTLGGGSIPACTNHVVCQQGTLMSYCQTCPGGLINTALTFHPVVRMTILDYLDTITVCDLEISGNCELAEPLLSVVHVPGDAASIAEAFWMVADGGEILVAPGTYHEQIEMTAWLFTFWEITVATGKSVAIRSTHGPEATILDGSTFDGSILSFIDTGDEHYVIEGFTITGGNASRGGGALVENSSVTFIDCIFADNTSASFGGAVSVRSSEAAFINCAFIGNSAVAPGGAIENQNSLGLQILIQDSFFDGNTSGAIGAAIFNNASAPAITNSIFRNNIADSGGAISNTVSSAGTTIGDSYFCGNQPNAISGGYVDAGGNVILEQCIPVDLNGDGVVDVSDLLILLAAWGPCIKGKPVPLCPADLNGDGVVDVSDLLILLTNWG